MTGVTAPMAGGPAPAPAVSVVTATYNWSSVLRYAIESVLWQTFPDFELLVIGDGCSDDSEAVVASFGDHRVRWHNLAENSGHQSTPNNVGLEMARGEFVAYLGHDDVWHPSHLAGLLDVLRAEQADFAHSLGVMIGPEGSNARILTGLWPEGEYTRGLSVPPSTLMHGRSFGRRIGGWRDYRSISAQPDLDLLVRAFDAGARFARVERLTVFKFNSSWRAGCYTEKPCHEQAEYVRRIGDEADFLEREWLAIARIPALGLPVLPPTIRHRADAPPGWLIGQYRRQRGLEAGAVELESADEARLRELVAVNEVLYTACRERLEALERLTADLLAARKESEMLRTACAERLVGLQQLTSDLLAARQENDVLRSACEERLVKLHELEADLLAARKDGEMLREACEERLRLIGDLAAANETLRAAVQASAGGGASRLGREAVGEEGQ